MKRSSSWLSHEDVSSYWMTLRKRQDTESLKRKHQIALCGEHVWSSFRLCSAVRGYEPKYMTIKNTQTVLLGSQRRNATYLSLRREKSSPAGTLVEAERCTYLKTNKKRYQSFMINNYSKNAVNARKLSRFWEARTGTDQFRKNYLWYECCSS